MSRFRRGALGCAIAASLGLTGCSAAAPPAPPTTVFVTVTPGPQAAPPPTPQAGTDVQQAVPPAPSPNAPAPVIEWGPGTDNGPRDGASGPAVSDADGQLISYTVVAGDSFFDISQRFDMPQQQLLRLNPRIHDLGETVYIGNVINLDWASAG